MIASPTHISPAAGGDVVLLAHNQGGHATDGSTVTVTDTLPAGLTPISATGNTFKFAESMTCSIAAQTVTCTVASVIAGLNTDRLLVDIQLSVEPGTSGLLPNQAAISGGGATPASTTEPITVSAQDPSFGIADFFTADVNAGGAPETRAGAHSGALVTAFDLNSIVSENSAHAGAVAPVGHMRDVVVDLPLGLVGNPQATPKCSEASLNSGATQCPLDTIVGTVTLDTGETANPQTNGNFEISNPKRNSPVTPIYNVQPKAGYPAEFAFGVSTLTAGLYARVVPTPAGYVLRVVAQGIERGSLTLKGAELTFFGDPRDQNPFGVAPGGTPAAVFTTPTDCSRPRFTTTIHIDSWENPASVPLNPDGSLNFEKANFSDPRWVTTTADSPPVTGCDKLQFTPSFSLQPDTALADSPSGVNFDLKVPQNADPLGLATPPLRDATVAVPRGVSLSPSAADGLQACSDAQAALNTTDPATCPLASQIGTVKIVTPTLPDPLTGQIFLSSPNCTPCNNADAQSGNMLRGFIQAEGDGVLIKVPGSFSADPQTGQLVAHFLDNPQFPFSDLQLSFKGGPRGVISTPETCGTFTTTSDLSPWSGGLGGTPDATPSDSFMITSGPDGGPCVSDPSQLPFSPTFEAGALNPQAGAFSPFILAFSRSDADQDLSGLRVTLPPGLLAKLAGVALCSDADANAGTCPAASQVGNVTTGAGPGSHPLFVPGRVFLTGPYKGGPYGLSVEVPAVAGPFNLGTVVVRQSLRVDPHTAQASVTSDPFPTILDGIPLQIRSVSVTVDRANFTFNPTSCDPSAVTGAISSTHNQTLVVSSHFQATNCASLPFKPSFRVSTQSKTSKANGASLDVKVAQTPGEASIHKVDVALPLALPSRLTTLQKACTQAQFESNPAGCPEGSFVGVATAHTPVLAAPLTGPAILVSHGGAAFPDLVIVLQGEGIRIDLVGNTDIKKGVTFSRFETVPDAPISSFELSLPEGPHSALAAYGNLCAQSLVMPTTIVGQSGAQVKQSTKITIAGCKAVTISKRQLAGRRVVLTFVLTAKGTVTVTGKGLKRYRNTLAAGTHQIKVALSKAGLSARRHHTKTKITVALKSGPTTSSSTTTLTL